MVAARKGRHEIFSCTVVAEKGRSKETKRKTVGLVTPAPQGRSFSRNPASKHLNQGLFSDGLSLNRGPCPNMSAPQGRLPLQDPCAQSERLRGAMASCRIRRGFYHCYGLYFVFTCREGDSNFCDFCDFRVDVENEI